MQVLCRRCHELSNGAMVPGVEDFSQRVAREPGQLQLNGKLLVTPEQLRAQLTPVKSKRAIVVLLVDILDASGSFLSKVRDLVGANPVVLIGTKVTPRIVPVLQNLVNMRMHFNFAYMSLYVTRAIHLFLIGHANRSILFRRVKGFGLSSNSIPAFVLRDFLVVVVWHWALLSVTLAERGFFLAWSLKCEVLLFALHTGCHWPPS